MVCALWFWGIFFFSFFPPSFFQCADLCWFPDKHPSLRDPRSLGPPQGEVYSLTSSWGKAGTPAPWLWTASRQSSATSVPSWTAAFVSHSSRMGLCGRRCELQLFTGKQEVAKGFQGREEKQEDGCMAGYFPLSHSCSCWGRCWCPRVLCGLHQEERLEAARACSASGQRWDQRGP